MLKKIFFEVRGSIFGLLAIWKAFSCLDETLGDSLTHVCPVRSYSTSCFAKILADNKFSQDASL